MIVRFCFRLTLVCFLVKFFFFSLSLAQKKLKKEKKLSLSFSFFCLVVALGLVRLDRHLPRVDEPIGIRRVPEPEGLARHVEVARARKPGRAVAEADAGAAPAERVRRAQAPEDVGGLRCHDAPPVHVDPPQGGQSEVPGVEEVVDGVSGRFVVVVVVSVVGGGSGGRGGGGGGG